MIRFYCDPSPNPGKVALFLEEAGLAYELVPIDTRKGEQHSADFTAINSSAKTRTLVLYESDIEVDARRNMFPENARPAA